MLFAFFLLVFSLASRRYALFSETGSNSPLSSYRSGDLAHPILDALVAVASRLGFQPGPIRHREREKKRAKKQHKKKTNKHVNNIPTIGFSSFSPVVMHLRKEFIN
jgi:hypothetical protein